MDVIPTGGAVGAYPPHVRTGDSLHSPVESISHFIQNRIITNILTTSQSVTETDVFVTVHGHKGDKIKSRTSHVKCRNKVFCIRV